MGTATFSIPAAGLMVSFARGVTAGLLEGDPRRRDAVTIVSELVTNSILHSRSRDGGLVDVCFELGRPLRIEVRDEGPATAAAREDGEGGLGLLVVEALAAKWGSEVGFAHALYWAELT